jgi:small conductance mechanosensitive channel
MRAARHRSTLRPATTAAMEFFARKGLHVVYGMLILVGLHLVGKAIEHVIIRKGIRADRQDSTVMTMIGHLVYFSIMFLGFMAVFRIFGLEIASIIAMTSVVGLSIGLSLQGSLSDIASGILITIFRIFNIGDVIKVGDIEGYVVDFKLIHTVIEELFTKALVTVPNRKFQSDVVGNITAQGYHYFVVDMLLSNTNTQFGAILDMLRHALTDAERFPDVLQNMPNGVGVLDISGPGTKLRVRVPVKTGPRDIVATRGAIRSALRDVLETNGVVMMEPVSLVASR